MPLLTRKRYKLPSSGPYLGVVTNHLDPTYMGGLEVSLVKASMGEINLQNETFIVKQMTPFYGVTPISAEGTNSADFQDVQKSYGMWFVPPDLGTTVMCIFIDGDPNQGYWMGCIPDPFQNHMVPGIAASQTVAMTAEQEKKYGTRNVPVAEFLKKGRDLSNREPDKFTKPIHPFADRLLAQGLLTDTVRGITSSSARREIPSAVFGISTPGPLDKNGKKSYIGYASVATAPTSRLGGSTFVMDDGDKDGQNELVRIRTRTGHQILMHNSQDLIYIANSKGSAWIELTSNGKIDIYAEDSVSIHTEQDFNFRADRDINIEAGRNLNIAVGKDMQTDVVGDYVLIVNNDGLLTFSGNYDHSVDSDASWSIGKNLHIGAGDSVYQTATKNWHLNAGTSIFQTAASNVNLKAGAVMNQESISAMNLKSGADWKVSAGGTTNITSSHHYETAGIIDMNGPPAIPADAAIKATAADSAEIPSNLPRYNLPNRKKDAGWDDSRFYKAEDIVSIMRRVPTHEPWDHHENINRTEFNPTATDNTAPAYTKSVKKETNTPSPGTVNEPPRSYNRQGMSANWVEDTAFIKKVKDVSTELKCSYIDLLTCMAFETGRTFDPGLRNSIGATGLIQFIRPVAISLGTTTDALAAMTRVEQMDWVLKYFKAGPIRKLSAVTLEDLYMAILWPVAVGKPLNYVLFSSPSKAYEQNKGLDLNKDGNITKEEAAKKARDQLNYVRTQLLKVKDEGGEWKDSGGNTITDGSGNAVRYGPYPPK